MATPRNAEGRQISPYPCDDSPDGDKGCGAKANEPCVYRPGRMHPDLVGRARTTMHWFRPRARSDGFFNDSRPSAEEVADDSASMPPLPEKWSAPLSPTRTGAQAVETTVSPATVEQPPPTPNRADLPSAHDLVIKDIEARRAVGHVRYGALLQPFNGRDALVDAYQEALDLAVYLRQAIEERDRVAAQERRMLDERAEGLRNGATG